jgi:hypothetical protein
MDVAEQVVICFGQPNVHESAKWIMRRFVEEILFNLMQKK